MDAWRRMLEPDHVYCFVDPAADRAARDQLERIRPRTRFAATPEVINPGAIRDLRLELPVAPPAVLGRVTPPIASRLGPPRMEIVLGDELLELAPELAIG